MSALRWGIVSAGRISHDFVCGLQTLPASDHQIVGVATRNVEDGRKFASEHGINKVYETYEELAGTQDVDIVYIGVINTLHYKISKLMIDSGKHVLCEKPLTMNKKQSESLIKHAEDKGVFFMEAIWSRSFPAYKKLAEVIASGTIGEVQFVNVTFGFPLASVDRVNVKQLGGGGILDIGIYTLQFAQYVFRNLKPDNFTGLGFLNQHQVDNNASCIIQYPGNKSAVLTISTVVELPNEAVVVGSKGTIKVETIRVVLKKELDLPIIEIEDPNAKLDGGDVLFTGQEFFVGISEYTNEGGALAVASAFPEYPCTPIKVKPEISIVGDLSNGVVEVPQARKLKSFVTVGGPTLLCVGAGKESQEVLKRMEREATFSYQTITLPEDEAANVLFLNGTLVHRSESEVPKSYQIFCDKIDARRTLNITELAKTSCGLTSSCLLVRRLRICRNS